MFKNQVKCTECGFLGTPGIGYDNVYRWNEIQTEARMNLSETLNDALPVSCMRGQNYAIAGVVPLERPISQAQLLKNMCLARKCMYYYPYNLGYSPEQHLELLRERTQRRFLIIVTLLSAAVGAGIATVVVFLLSS